LKSILVVLYILLLLDSRASLELVGYSDRRLSYWNTQEEDELSSSMTRILSSWWLNSFSIVFTKVRVGMNPAFLAPVPVADSSPHLNSTSPRLRSSELSSRLFRGLLPGQERSKKTSRCIQMSCLPLYPEILPWCKMTSNSRHSLKRLQVSWKPAPACPAPYEQYEEKEFNTILPTLVPILLPFSSPPFEKSKRIPSVSLCTVWTCWVSHDIAVAHQDLSDLASSFEVTNDMDPLNILM